MSPRHLFRIGAIGAVLSALCCFTPLAVISLTALGMGAAVSYLDRVLWPLMAAFLVVMVLAWLRMRPVHGTRESNAQGETR